MLKDICHWQELERAVIGHWEEIGIDGGIASKIRISYIG
jgi:hypothetical protein